MNMTDNKYKVGIIGAGVIADFHAQALQAMPNTELVAAYARNQQKADLFSQKYGCAATQTWSNLFSIQAWMWLRLAR